VRDETGRAWKTHLVSAADLRRSVPAIRADEEHLPGFVRDARYFLWRFASPHAAERYSFVLCHAERGDERLVIALTAHRFRGLRLGVLADVYPRLSAHRYGLNSIP
jgi:hypothetical protein